MVGRVRASSRGMHLYNSKNGSYTGNCKYPPYRDLETSQSRLSTLGISSMVGVSIPYIETQGC